MELLKSGSYISRNKEGMIGECDLSSRKDDLSEMGWSLMIWSNNINRLTSLPFASLYSFKSSSLPNIDSLYPETWVLYN